MRELVAKGRIIGFRRRTSRRSYEGFTRGKLDAVRRVPVEGASPSVVDPRAGRGDPMGGKHRPIRG